MARFRRWLFALLLVTPLLSSAQDTAAPASPTATEERHEDHEALRALMKKAVEALNTRNFDAIAPALHKNFTIITVDNRKFTSLDEFKAYWNGLFSGPAALLKQIEARPQADELTQFLDADTGVTHGSSSDVYHFSDGTVRTMSSRWTVVVEKDADGWKIAKAHFSANLLDNPVIDAVKATVYQAAIGGLMVGLILGGGIIALLKRGPKT